MVRVPDTRYIRRWNNGRKGARDERSPSAIGKERTDDDHITAPVSSARREQERDTSSYHSRQLKGKAIRYGHTCFDNTGHYNTILTCSIVFLYHVCYSVLPDISHSLVVK
jgi:hypothetical protein